LRRFFTYKFLNLWLLYAINIRSILITPKYSMVDFDQFFSAALKNSSSQSYKTFFSSFSDIFNVKLGHFIFNELFSISNGHARLITKKRKNSSLAKKKGSIRSAPELGRKDGLKNIFKNLFFQKY